MRLFDKDISNKSQTISFPRIRNHLTGNLKALAERPIALLIFPNLFGFKGGEQVYGRSFLKALEQISHSTRFTVLLKRDKKSSIVLRKKKGKYYCFGDLPSYLRNIALGIQFLKQGIFERPHVSITGHVNYAPLCCLLNYLTGTPYIVVAHGLEVWDLKETIRQFSLRRAYRILAVSEFTRMKLITQQGVSPDKIIVLPNTIDDNRFKISHKPAYLLNRYSIQKEQPTILTITRLTQYKGVDRILYALPTIRQDIPNVHYIISGKGKDKSRLQTLIKKLNLQACVTLTSFIPEQELCDHYNLCDIYAMPSTGEGFGIVFLEALACGKPTLAGNCDGSSEPLMGGHLGCLVDPKNSSEISTSIIQILSRTYPNSLIYQPEKLRAEVMKRFSFYLFCKTLADSLSAF